MKFVLIGADGNPKEATPNGLANIGQIKAVICLDNSGNAVQVTKEQLQSYLNGDITFDDVALTGTLQVGGASLFTGQVTFSAPNIYSYTTGIIAGTTQTQAGATLLTTEWNNVTTVGTTNDGVRLPTAVGGLVITVKNTGANIAKIYPFLGDFIDDELVNVAITIAVEQEITFRCISTTVWESDIENITETIIAAATGNITTLNSTTANIATINEKVTDAGVTIGTGNLIVSKGLQLSKTAIVYGALYTALKSDYHIYCSTGTGATTVDIGTFAFPVNTTLVISDFDCISSTSNITIDAVGANRIIDSVAGGAQTLVVNTNGESVTLHKISATQWKVI